jgi:hypothetical protein
LVTRARPIAEWTLLVFCCAFFSLAPLIYWVFFFFAQPKHLFLKECQLNTIVLSKGIGLKTLLFLRLFAPSAIHLVTLNVLHYEKLVIEIKVFLAERDVLPIIILDYYHIFIILVLIGGSLLCLLKLLLTLRLPGILRLLLSDMLG